MGCWEKLCRFYSPGPFQCNKKAFVYPRLTPYTSDAANKPQRITPLIYIYIYAHWCRGSTTSLLDVCDGLVVVDIVDFCFDVVIRLYACACVCVCVGGWVRARACMYVCMYVCIYACGMHKGMYMSMQACTHARTHASSALQYVDTHAGVQERRYICR